MHYVYFPYNKRRHVKICQALRQNRFAANVSEPKTPAISIGLSRQTTVIHSDLSIKRFRFRHKEPLWAREGINHPRTSHRRVCSARVHVCVCVTHTDSQPPRRIVHQRQTKIVNCTSVGAIKTSLKHWGKDLSGYLREYTHTRTHKYAQRVTISALMSSFSRISCFRINIAQLQASNICSCWFESVNANNEILLIWESNVLGNSRKKNWSLYEKSEFLLHSIWERISEYTIFHIFLSIFCW